MEDQMIIDLLFARSEEAIRAVSEKYGSLCKRVSSRILNSSEDVEECMNDTFLVLWNTIPPQKPESLPAYICKVLRNVSLKKYRYNTAEKRNASYNCSVEELVEHLEGKDDVLRKLEEKELAAALNQFLETCKPVDRVIFVKKYYLFLETEEIAKQMHLTKNYVNVHLFRTREKLKAFMEEGGLL